MDVVVTLSKCVGDVVLVKLVFWFVMILQDFYCNRIEMGDEFGYFLWLVLCSYCVCTIVYMVGFI